jgi:hypothetical protein
LIPCLTMKIELARAGADCRLPALDRQVDRAWNQREFLQRIAAIGNLGRQHVMLALMRKTLVIERLENNLHLLFEQLAIGVLVEHRKRGRSPAIAMRRRAGKDLKLGQDLMIGLVIHLADTKERASGKRCTRSVVRVNKTR